MTPIPDSPSWVPDTVYARNGETHIAYQAFGEGEVTFVGVPGKPGWRRLLRALRGLRLALRRLREGR